MEKGSYGYIKYKKKRLVIYLIIDIVLALGIFLTGLVLNDFSNKNLFSVIAVLFVLPGAKIVTSLVVIWPYKALAIEKYKELSSRVKSDKAIVYDLILTSAEKVMYIQAIVIMKDKYLVLIDKKQDTEYMKKYIAKHMYNYGFEKEVEIITEYESLVKLFEDLYELEDENLDELIRKLMILEI